MVNNYYNENNIIKFTYPSVKKNSIIEYDY